MAPAAHATLSASGAHRWINCTPSALIEAAIRAEHGDASSPAAEQGTIAHALVEWKIRRLDHRLRDGAGEKPVSPLIDEEMEDHTSDYATFILERATQAKAEDPSFVLAVEQRLGKKRFTELLGHLVHKPAGKPALVPVTDKRPALTLRDPATEFTTINQAKA
ncbi:DUF2800 domain-containing protein [Corynebacterium sp. sy039]|uniref:DUF2800 domain-containing protein n=1 Tax=Corynebacterium sp. sy039 TaxID=2599641 RepID=UPI0011B8092D|nr:DUF2800 domain-containing protein [Corynebacterium sp. sy039]QDZ42457.1 DUF2800 domain-containing protein [Corynebacterium sp. sy039]